MDSSAEDSVLHRRETDRESCLRLEFSIYIICPAVESPHNREARLFQGRLRDRERATQRYCFWSKRQTDRTPGRRKSSRQRGLSFQ
ncbi:hypothetical protein GBAR_LOCUS10807, partial [Geodia barretti]